MTDKILSKLEYQIRLGFGWTRNIKDTMTELKTKLDELQQKGRRADSPAEYFTPADILPEPLGQDVIDALGGLNCMGCFNNEIEESHENLTAWKKMETIKAWIESEYKIFTRDDYWKLGPPNYGTKRTLEKLMEIMKDD